MDLSYMQREATDLAIDRLIHCADSVRGDFGNGTSTSFVGTGGHASTVSGKRPVRCIQCDNIIQVKVMKD
jgi:hypothetical protein